MSYRIVEHELKHKTWQVLCDRCHCGSKPITILNGRYSKTEERRILQRLAKECRLEKRISHKHVCEVCKMAIPDLVQAPLLDIGPPNRERTPRRRKVKKAS